MGWRDVIPVGTEPREKYPPVTGYTGHNGDTVSPDDIKTWIHDRGERNLAIRLPPNVVGLDVDAYDGKPGLETWTAVCDIHGDPPPTWTATSRDDGSGIRLHRLPDNVDASDLGGKLVHPRDSDRSGVEVIHHGHRYVVAWPSTHPEGRRYAWFMPDGDRVTKGKIPSPDDLPVLPGGWVRHLVQDCACFASEDARQEARRHRAHTDADKPQGDVHPVVEDISEEWAARLTQAWGRHDAARGGSLALTGLATGGWPGAEDRLEDLRRDFLQAVAGDRDRDEAQAEWDRLVEGAEEKADPVPYDPPTREAGPEEADDDDDTGNTSVRNRAIEVITPAVDLFHTPDGTPYASVTVDGDRDAMRVESQAFRGFVQREVYNDLGEALNQNTVNDIQRHFAVRARYDAPPHEAYLRLAPVDDGLVLDLGDDQGRAVHITPDGWRVVNDADVRFERPKNYKALPIPEPGDIHALRDVLPPGVDDDALRLCAAWLLGTLHPEGPYPVLIVVGPEGSAKSSTCRALRGLVDPSHPRDTGRPRSERDLAIHAEKRRVVALDNLSSIPTWLSDALCRLATGAGLSTRELYSDRGEVTFDLRKPLLMNGITNPATERDLLDRAIVLNLPRLDPRSGDYQTESEWRDAYQEARPKVLGALLDGASAVLAGGDANQGEWVPRMADFAAWVRSVAGGMGLEPSRVLRAYKENRENVVEESLEADPVALTVRALIKREGSWRGSASKLLDQLEAWEQWKGDVPQTAQHLGQRLKKAESFLAEAGVRWKKVNREYVLEWTRDDGEGESPGSAGEQDTL